jgi:hypothetical protein
MEKPYKENPIQEDEHSLLLFRLGNLTHADERVCRLEENLKAGLAKYHELLGDLQDTVGHYMEAAKEARELVK